MFRLHTANYKYLLALIFFSTINNVWANVKETVVWNVLQQSIPQENQQEQDTTLYKPQKPYERDRLGDPVSTPQYSSPIIGTDPHVNTQIELDTTGNGYNVQETLGDGLQYRNPSYLPYDAYRDYLYRKNMASYYKNLSLQQDGGDALPGQGNGKLIPDIELGRVADFLFGGSTLDFQLNGNAMLDFGFLFQRVDNPQVPVTQQRNGGFNFDQQVGLGMIGKIGDKLEMSANFDTKSTFQFDQQYNMSYTAYDYDIIQDIQVGNVSFNVRNSLISGAQNLFGVYSKLRFGNLYVSSVFSSQRGSQETITIKNGGQNREFEFRADTYDNNKHFFIGHFFRDKYEEALKTTPNIISGVVVTRMKVYVTNRANDTQTQRNLVGLLDLGEADPYNTAWGGSTNPAASNDANTLYSQVTQLNRNSDAIKGGLEGLGLNNGTEFEILRSARELGPTEFSYNQQLGYISINTPLRNDEILAVAFEYTFNGQSYKVGELNEDLPNLGQNEVMFMKLLSPSTIITTDPNDPSKPFPLWDLMMKNVYSLQANSIQKEDFQFRIIYRDDRTGVDNPSIQEGVNLANVPLIEVTGLDRLNMNLELQKDGNFDFIEGVTIDSRNGRIIFPVLEPFGQTLEEKFEPGEGNLVTKYVFEDLYKKTQADAVLNTKQNKYFMKGSYKGGSSNEILLPGINIAENSVTITAGGVTLTEGAQYTVDYQFGRVTILDEGVLNSGKDIRITYERADLFNFQTKTLAGVDLEYHVSEDFIISGTLMHLSEKPLISRVNVGSEPVKNTMWGLTMDYTTESRFLTKLVDAIPGIDTQEQSMFTFKGEFAQLIPGTPSLIGTDGTGYIDDFEGAEVPYDLGLNPVSWAHGSTPEYILDQQGWNTAPPTTAEDSLAYNHRRALMAWYNIDNVFYYTTGNTSRPNNITDEDMQNHYVRLVPFNEVFKNRQANQINTNEVTFDLAYYPSERGPYNYNTDLNNDGTLRNPKDNFGAITKAITTDVDFDNLNVQYIEFWMMDPFMTGKNAEIEGANNNTGGKLFIDLGSISEDVVPDGRHFFENGMTTNKDLLNRSVWGYSPTTQFVNNVFSTAVPRDAQDIGYDGLSSEEEAEFFKQFFIDRLPSVLSPEALQAIIADPSGDDFKYYLGDEADAQNLKVLERYKRFNGTERNSPENQGGGGFTPSNTSYPNNEDLNGDNTLNELNAYFEYELDLRPGQLENNKFVVDRVTSEAPESRELVTWYQVRIPIRDDNNYSKVGGIDNFKSVKFMRLFMTDWEQPVVLRMLNFQLVGAQWRQYTQNIEDDDLPISTAKVEISSVNIEQNGVTDTQTRKIPYVLPPGFERDYDATSTVTRRINEQSIQVNVEDLDVDDGIGIFKNFSLNLVNYKRLKMELHAQSPSDITRDDEVRGFLRVGTDLTDNYYEIEVPLKITQKGATTPEVIWPRENEIDIALEELYKIKVQRNSENADRDIPYPTNLEAAGPNVRQYRVRVVGNPDMSAIQTAMIGVRNKTTDNARKDIRIWANELRATEYSTFSSWAANASIDATLADFANIKTNVRYSTVGFGGIQDKIGDRQMEDNLEFGIAANINLDKIFLNRIGLSVPIYMSYDRKGSNPYFDPLDPDVPLDVSSEVRGSYYSEQVKYLEEARSINISNLTKVKMNPEAKSYPWDIENFSLSGSYSDRNMRDKNTEAKDFKQWKLGAAYSYQSPLKAWEPFKDTQGGDWSSLITDFNLNPLPSSITVRGDLDRQYRYTQFRSYEEGRGFVKDGILPTYEKSFLFNRGYNLGWNLAKSLKIDYQATANALVDEPEGAIDTDTARDSIMNNLLDFGRMKLFTQNLSGTYNIPINKVPGLDFIGANARYVAGTNWTAGTLGIADTLGNTIGNTQQISLNSKFDFKNIYKKIGYVNHLENGVSNRGRSRSRNRNQQQQQGGNRSKKPTKDYTRLAYQKVKLKDKLKDLRTEQTNLQNADKDKIDKQKEKIEAKITKLKTKIEKYKGKGKDYADLDAKILTYNTQIDTLDAQLAKENPKKNKKLESIAEEIKKTEQELLAVNDQLKERPEPTKSAGEKLGDTGIRFLTMLKDIDMTYSENNATTLPGYMPTAEYVGLDSKTNAPGLPFLLGSQDPSIRFKAAENGWLAPSEYLNNQFVQTKREEYRVRANLEPFRDFKVTLTSTSNRTESYSEVFRFDSSINDYNSLSPTRTGTFGISFFSMGTAFSKPDGNNESEVFNQFVANRSEVKDRLNSTRTSSQTQYKENDQDVLIPAFIAAYTGQSSSKVGLSAFPSSFPIPNWDVRYTGLSKLKVFENSIKSITLAHAYQSNYTVGNYNSSLLYGATEIGPDRDINDQPVAEGQDGNIVPVYVINQVNIEERFGPLIGINIKLMNDLQIKFDYNKGRMLSLNLSNAQVTEQLNNDFTIDIGYTTTGMKLPFRSKGRTTTLKNDITFRLAMSIRDNQTTQYRMEEENVVTAGNMNFALRPTVNYMLNDRANLQFYFDRTINDPKVSNAFRRTSTAFGVQFKYSLTQ
ncbi:cell surface protein SprA [Flammeovirga yaeyamensis]|uniref:Cell surface protein SprA n=1 Tax=Flammeovirga yaeyamensis TaxID=367791 RepID=A0AAX1N815_9BACT|nr:cell surface protein SprA [Flammeovirga yaeyamensis]MBB3699010.1 cell surface protein SprA [Flammeovirga yaeyamensis]NMF36444.1 cell surface protein SprA [Flammeovirga yaeyamensis]QWG03597.1 cell surface protein SprA [Flammeovirga yaeyamensis]